MKIELLIKLLKNILSIEVASISNDLDVEEKIQAANDKSTFFKFNKYKDLKILYNPNAYYELVDSYKTRRFSFTVENQIVIIGPYLQKEMTELEIKKIAKENDQSIDEYRKLKNFYLSCPIANANYIENIVNSILKSLYGDIVLNFGYIRIDDTYDNINKNMNYNYIESYEDIIKKYELENSFLKTIETGNIEKLIEVYKPFTSIINQNKYSKYISEEPQISLASLRAISRKAAERSGLPVIKIEEIVMKYTKLMKNTNNYMTNNYAFDYLLELTNAVKEYKLANGNYSPLIKQVTDYLYANFNSDIIIADLAKKFKVSIYYLERSFKNEVRKTIHEYIEEIRLNRAIDLLTNTNESISEIAFQVGYLDNNYFTKVFKKKYNITPSKYRKEA